VQRWRQPTHETTLEAARKRNVATPIVVHNTYDEETTARPRSTRRAGVLGAERWEASTTGKPEWLGPEV
jgi:hypothetical protein